MPRGRQHAERRIAAGPGQVLGEDARQHEPNPVRHAFPFLGADRPVQEVIFVGREVGRRLAPEELDVRQPGPQRAEDDCRGKQKAAEGAVEEAASAGS